MQSKTQDKHSHKLTFSHMIQFLDFVADGHQLPWKFLCFVLQLAKTQAMISTFADVTDTAYYNSLPKSLTHSLRRRWRRGSVDLNDRNFLIPTEMLVKKLKFGKRCSWCNTFLMDFVDKFAIFIIQIQSIKI